MKGLEEGETYVFRVRSVNANGIGKPSQLSDPVCAKALPGNDNGVVAQEHQHDVLNSSHYNLSEDINNPGTENIFKLVFREHRIYFGNFGFGVTAVVHTFSNVCSD